MENIKQVLETYKQELADISNKTKDYHYASRVSHVIGRVELLEEAIKELK